MNTAQLIIAAEQSGMIHRLDEQVISRVFEHLALLQQNGIQTRLAVNLSGRSFNNPNLVPHVRQSLSEFGVTPSSVIFEITETAAIANLMQARRFVNAIHALGGELCSRRTGQARSRAVIASRQTAEL